MDTVKEYDGLKIPDYALSYLVNGDSSGIESEDIQNIDAYMKQYYDEAEKLTRDTGMTHHVLFAIDDTEQEGYFTWHPAFGLACSVYDCTVLILK